MFRSQAWFAFFLKIYILGYLSFIWMFFKKKGQVSIEYLAIFSVAALMLIPLIILFATQTDNIEADIAYAQAENAMTRIIDSAEEIYFQGPPAQKTLRVQFPRGIETIMINEHDIIFEIQTSDGVFYVEKHTPARLAGELKPFPGSHVIRFESFEDLVYIEDK